MPVELDDLIGAFPALGGITPADISENRTFKETAQDDLVKRRVWFDDTEMADYHDINGSRILCVFDRYESAVASVESGRTGNFARSGMSGLQTDLYLLFIRADECGDEPRIGGEIKVDGRKFYVHGLTEYGGVNEITMKAASVR